MEQRTVPCSGENHRDGSVGRCSDLLELCVGRFYFDRGIIVCFRMWIVKNETYFKKLFKIGDVFVLKENREPSEITEKH